MPYETFPSFPGLGWDIKKRVLFSNNRETSASGAEFTTARWTLPHFEIDLDYNFLSQSDRDSFEAFFIARRGSFEPFLLALTNDRNRAGASLTPAPDGVRTQFTIVGMPAQTNVTGTPTAKVNGGAVSATVTAEGVATFAVAPAAGTTLSIDYDYAYVVRFKDDKCEFNQLMDRMYEQKKISFRTVR
jgi:hypothetical protein